MRIRCKVWLEGNGRMLFGKGRALILQAIEEEGSLMKAAVRLNMSYRAAWGKLRASETHLGVKLVEPGAAGRHGLKLTQEGRLLLREYERLVRETEGFLDRRLSRFAGALGKTGSAAEGSGDARASAKEKAGKPGGQSVAGS